MNRFVFAEPKLCIGCNTCMAACSVVHKAAGLQSHPRLTVTRTGQGTAPVLCRHCEDAPCARVCPVNAIVHTADSISLNETLCIGCKLCAIACPFGAITPAGTPCEGVVATSLAFAPPQIASAPDAQANDSAKTLSPLLVWQPGVRTIAVKCDLCEFSPLGAECVRVCPTHALHLIAPEQLAQDADLKRKAAMVALGENVAVSQAGANDHE